MTTHLLQPLTLHLHLMRLNCNMSSPSGRPLGLGALLRAEAEEARPRPQRNHASPLKGLCGAVVRNENCPAGEAKPPAINRRCTNLLDILVLIDTNLSVYGPHADKRQFALVAQALQGRSVADDPKGKGHTGELPKRPEVLTFEKKCQNQKKTVKIH